MTTVDDKTVLTPPDAKITALSRTRRVAAAAALFVAPWGFVISNAGYAWAIRNGGSDETGAAALALVDAEPAALQLAVIAGLIGCLLVVPAVFTAMNLARRSWPAFVGGSLMIGGYICYFGVLLSNMMIIAMADHGGPLGDYAAVIDASQSNGSTAWVFGLFVVGNLLGTLLLAIGLLRTRAVPVWAALLIMAWPPLHVTGLILGNELWEVTGAVLQAVGFAGTAVVVLRRRT
jgi:hypothetical protein